MVPIDLDLISHAVSITLLVAAALSFAFKGWISEWIKSRFAKEVSRELDQYKHGLNLDLEAYKTSLIRELEKDKADIDLRRSIALKMADARLDALSKLFVCFNIFYRDAVVFSRATSEARAILLADVFEIHDTFSRVMSEVQIFISPRLFFELTTYKNDLFSLLSLDSPIMQRGDPETEKMLLEGARLSMSLREQIYQPPPELKATGLEADMKPSIWEP